MGTGGSPRSLSASGEPTDGPRSTPSDLIKKHRLLLARYTGRRAPCEHDGQLATERPDICWCSDDLEFTSGIGEVVRVAFTFDCYDGEVIG